MKQQDQNQGMSYVYGRKLMAQDANGRDRQEDYKQLLRVFITYFPAAVDAYAKGMPDPDKSVVGWKTFLSFVEEGIDYGNDEEGNEANVSAEDYERRTGIPLPAIRYLINDETVISQLLNDFKARTGNDLRAKINEYNKEMGLPPVTAMLRTSIVNENILFITAKAYMDAWIPVQEASGSSDSKQNLVRDAYAAFLEYLGGANLPEHVKALQPALLDTGAINRLKDKLKKDAGYDVEKIVDTENTFNQNKTFEGGELVGVGPEGTDQFDEDWEKGGEEWKKGVDDWKKPSETKPAPLDPKYKIVDDMQLHELKDIDLKTLFGIIQDAPKEDDIFSYGKKRFIVDHVDYPAKMSIVRRTADSK